MRKTIPILLACLCLVSYFAEAQRHVKGIKQLEAGAGITGVGLYGQVGYVHFFSNKLYLQGNIIAENGTLKSQIDGGDVSYKSYAAAVQGGYNIWNNETIFFNAKAGIGLGLENGNLKNPPTIYVGETAKNGSFVAGSIGTEIEIYISDKFVLVPHFNQWLLGVGQSTYGNARYFAGLSLRFGINR